MNQDNELSRDHAQALADLLLAQRRSQSATDQMDEAFAALLGVNRTDARCLDIVHRLGKVTAGALGREAGLTSGAVTTLLDRMEAAGYLQRQPDPKDRRKVLVAPTERVIAIAEAVYGQIGRLGQKHMAGMPRAQMELVTRYLRTGAWANAALAQELRQAIAETPGSDPLARAEAFAARIATRSAALDQGMLQAWAEGEKP